MTLLLDTALAMHAAGYAVLPVRPDGTKAPAVPWRTYVDQPPDPDQLRAWFDGGQYDGLGVITGRDGLVMLEAEGRAVTDRLHEQLAQLMTDSGLGDLWARLCSGWMELTPSGGLHWYIRVVDQHGRPADVDGNTKLARRPGRDGTPVEVLFETRGAGGFTVTAPSAGQTHPSGKPWLLLAGGHATPAVVTVEEYDAIKIAMSTFDQMPTTAPPDSTTTGRPGGQSGDRPGDDFNARATWDDILIPRGWTKGRTVGGATAWTRPGKSPRDGISATTGKTLHSDGADRLYVFSTSTEFEAEKPYDKLGAIALLEHGGSIADAARALRGDGYGAPLEEERIAHTVIETTIDDILGHADNTPPVSGPLAQVVEQGPATYTLTDDGNALRLIDQHAHQLRYCPQRGSWLTWGGHRWLWDSAEHVNELARSIARQLPAGSKLHDAHRARSLSTRGILAMVRLARSDQRTVIHLDQLDNQPYQINTPSGVVDLRTGRLLTPDPAMLHTRSTTITPAAAYQPGDAPQWERFLADTFAGDPDLTIYLQRILGQALIGQVLEQLLPFAYGAGANGKTTLLGVVQRLVGIGDQGYSISAPAELLLATANPGHPTEIARLAGARLVVTSELEDGQRFAEARVKQLTGRDTISGRFMRQDWFSFTPSHTLFLLANHQPEVRAGGEAFWRRIKLVPFLHTVPPEDRNPHLEEQLVEREGAQILAWLIAGAVDYLNHGLAQPASVEAATSSYAASTDTVGRFVDDCCETAAPGTQTYAIASSKLRQAYETWCRQEGETPVSAKALGSTLIARFGVVSTRIRTGRLLDGIRLRPDLTDGQAASDGSQERSQWWQE